MHKMMFACFTAGKKDAVKALLLAESIRVFAGEYSTLPFLLMIPEGNDPLPKKVVTRAAQLDVELHPFALDPQAASFPFAGKVVASAAAEALAEGRSAQLVWMDNAALVVNPLDDLLLENGNRLGYRPVDHLLIGSRFDRPIDAFWEYVYNTCGVNAADIFPMVTSTDQVKMRPYLNAGMLDIRPEDKLLRRWCDTFLEHYQDRQLLDFYQEKRHYKIFIHQAVLAGCAMTSYQESEIVELPYQVNYPLHMHTRYPQALQPASLDQLISFRYEQFFTRPDWQELIEISSPHKEWLGERENLLARR